MIFNLQATIEVPGIRRLWSLRISEKELFDKYLVQSFISETRILAIEDDEMSEVDRQLKIAVVYKL